MRKLFLFLFFLFPVAAEAVLLNFTPTITITGSTTTTMRIQLAGLRATGIDTIKVYSAGADSATGQKYWFKAATSKDTTVTLLTPMKQYIWKVRADSAGTYRTSVPDTAATYPPQVVTAVAIALRDDYRTMQRANSWPTTSTYTAYMSISTSTGLDSTMVYDIWTLTGFLIKVTGDSGAVKLRAWGGNSTNDKATYHPTATAVVWNYAVLDSLTTTASGTYKWTLTNPTGCRYVYLEALGQTDCGNNVTIVPDLKRSRW